ncbi:MAG: NAD-glutamate dehydrogenase [Porticoccaceae bacterium]
MMNKNLNDAFYGEIKNHFEKSGVDDVSAMLAFAKKLHTLAPLEELSKEPVADLCGLIQSLRLYLEKLPEGTAKVRSFNPSLNEDGWEHPCTQIFILSRDMAFLVDSVRLELTRLGLAILRINSTVLDVVRDGDGNLLRWLDKPENGSHKEALIYFQVEHYLAEQRHQLVAGDIFRVLEQVRAVNDDYPPMLRALGTARDGLGAQNMAESRAFLDWLIADHFTFLSYTYYSLSGGEDPVLAPVPEKSLGLAVGATQGVTAQRLSELPEGVLAFHRSSAGVALAKSASRAPVHRDQYGDYVIVKDLDDEGRLRGEHRFLGLYASLVYTQSPFNVPLVGSKLERIFRRSGLDPSSHYGKVLRQIIEVHPRDELFVSGEDALYETLVGIWQINERRQVRLFITPDPYGRFVYCTVYFPRDTYRTEVREKTQRLLMEAFDASDYQFSTFFTQSLLVRTHFVMRIDSARYKEISVQDLERQIAALATDWRDDLQRAIKEHWGDERGIALSAMYRDAFSLSYQEHFDPRTAAQDIDLFHALGGEEEIATRFFQPLGARPGIMRLKIFHRKTELSLSRMVPLLENLGFQVIGEHPYPIRPDGVEPVWMSDFTLRFSLDIDVDVAAVRQNFVDAFEAVWQGRAGDDSFNGLVIGARLDWRSVALLRLYARYMKQLGIPIGQDFVAATLAANLDITRNLVALFKCCFDPRLATDGRSERVGRLETKILDALDNVKNLNQDQVLRTYRNLICATLRTNFFQRDASGDFKPYIAVKLAPKQLALAPEPRPEYEIFVSSPRFEGVHLRAGKVARGGIRWSDRLEDYRTEVLGLVKAQQVKNAVIVPTGAKGGFVLRQAPLAQGREAVLAEARNCYRAFMGALLDITDNIRDGAIMAPHEVVRRDGDDPYLVVAADKGTAAFSDLANDVSADYGHWLGDAFASGGSNGYDHKKMGITARGAWVAVQRHFRELGVNVQEEAITAVGIGDMSGDVFGNGMLRSPHLHLVAAFNHNAIFLDPDPDAASSFGERQRLFEAGLGWFDYDTSLISAGGGVFSRELKTISLTPEVQKRFAIEESALTPAQLIHHLLRAQVDLVWNGGIGTYVKAREESHADVGDRANDELRVDGRDLRCRVFGEGGNLGMTQRGRIEFCLHGGACNTDFIDNSGGVDSSDQEVNIKIALNGLVVGDDLTLKQRNALLESMTNEVADKVLLHNYRQTQTLSLAQLRSASNPSEFWHCILDWEREGLLDRALEYLPDDDTLANREKSGPFLTRPELAVLLSYSKMLFKQQLQHAELDADPYIFAEIHGAFPATLVDKHPAAIESHALRHDVLCTQLANEIIDFMGLTFVHRQMKSTGASAADVARAYLIARDVFQFETVWREVEELDYRAPARTQGELHLSLMRLGRRTTRWLLRNRRAGASVAEEIAALKPSLQSLLTASLGAERDEDDADDVVAGLSGLGLSDYALMLIDSASDLYFALGMADVSITTGADIDWVIEAYDRLGDVLQLEWVTRQITELVSASRWDDFARESFMDDLESQFRRLAAAALRRAASSGDLEAEVAAWQSAQAPLIARWQDMLREIRITAEKQVAMFSVALREFADLVAASQ